MLLITMKVLLKDISTIQAGHPFREKIEFYPEGDYSVIQIKDVGTDGRLLTDELLQTQIEKTRPEFFVKKNDVLFTTRGLNRRACFVGEELANTVFVAQIFALRVPDNKIEPSYLAWYLNQKDAQEYLDATASGSYIQNVRKDILANLPIKVPPMETQKKIVEINRLALREKNLIEQIQKKRDQLIERVLLNTVNKGEI